MESNPKINGLGAKVWCNEKDQLHRIGGPAIIYPDGEEHWYINGERIEPMPNIIRYLRKKLKQ